MKKNILIVAPHQDDDIINHSILIDRELKKWNNINIVYTTTWARFSNTAMQVSRKKAIISTLKKFFNITENSLTFFNIEAETTYKKENAKNLFFKIKEYLDANIFDEVYIPTYEWWHIDHDVTHFLVVYYYKCNHWLSDINIFEYPAYNNYMNLKRFYLFVMREFLKKIWLDNAKYQLPKDFIPYDWKEPSVVALDATNEDLLKKTEIINNYFYLEHKNMWKNFYKNAHVYSTDKFISLREYDYTKPPHCTFPINLWITLANKIKFTDFVDMVKYFLSKEYEK